MLGEDLKRDENKTSFMNKILQHHAGILDDCNWINFKIDLF